MSGRPGQQVGVPNSNNGGAIAMSPDGHIGRGTRRQWGRIEHWPWSGRTGQRTRRIGLGRGKEGTGHGSDTIASTASRLIRDRVARATAQMAIASRARSFG